MAARVPLVFLAVLLPTPLGKDHELEEGELGAHGLRLGSAHRAEHGLRLVFGVALRATCPTVGVGIVQRAENGILRVGGEVKACIRGDVERGGEDLRVEMEGPAGSGQNVRGGGPVVAQVDA
jgi:hypothetical protein